MTLDEIQNHINAKNYKALMIDRDDLDEDTLQLSIEIEGVRYLVHVREADGSVIHFEEFC